MKSVARIIVFVLFASGSFAQDVIPAGTILPAQLSSSLRSNRLRPGQTICARLIFPSKCKGGLIFPTALEIVPVQLHSHYALSISSPESSGVEPPDPATDHGQTLAHVFWSRRIRAPSSDLDSTT
jgi:hypothetical protein